MAFGGGTKPAKMMPNPKSVQTASKGPALGLAKPTAKGISKPSPKSGCCGNK